MGNAYRVISDLHRHYSKANRFDYSKEVKYVDKVIEDQLNHYKEMGYNNYLIYLGDVFDISMRSSESSMKFLSQSEHQIKMASGAFSVVGNHEFTYYASNPFWYLMKEINSNKVSNYRNGKFKAKGFNNHLIIPDRVIDGEVEFLFNHYGCGIEVPNSDKISIGFFHQDVIFKSILEDAKNNNRDVFISNEKEIETKYSKFVNLDKSNALLGYDRCYFGHNHLLYGSPYGSADWVEGGVQRVKYDVNHKTASNTYPIGPVLDTGGSKAHNNLPPYMTV